MSPGQTEKACRLPVLYAMWMTPKQNLHSGFPATECFETGKHGRLWGREAKYLLNGKTRDLCCNGKSAVLGVLVKTYNKIVALSLIISLYAGHSLLSLPRLLMARSEMNIIPWDSTRSKKRPGARRDSNDNCPCGRQGDDQEGTGAHALGRGYVFLQDRA